ncbi:MAG: division/cell wall cluster transcriptional repressor MraZ [Bacteroidales bacterium]|nr:division/cell wall cluster transcriptional repressor MraZ [Bacteroidales bacterium]
MTNFIGDYTCKLDSKGRVLLPSAFKKQMSPANQESFVIKKDIFAKCLVIFPIEEWNRQNDIIRAKTNPYNREHNQFLRTFYKGTAEISLDGNNRLLIPKRLLDEIEAENEVVLAGQFNKIELWPKENYHKVISGDDEFASLAEKILGGLNLESNE